MSTKPVLNSIKAALGADLPVVLWGAPGSGKTAAIQALAEQERATLVTLIASTHDPGEILGLFVPSAGSGKIHFAPAPWVVTLLEALRAARPAWLFLDEFSCAPASVQATLLRVVHERRVDDIDLRGIRVIAASNPADTAADGGSLSAASSSRWLHLDFPVNSDTWVGGELAGWGKQQAPVLARARALVGAWIKHAPGKLLKVPEKEVDRERGWPCPRSWSAVSRAVASLCDATGATPQKALLSREGQLLASGLVGNGAAQEFTTWATTLDLPDPEDVLAGKAKMPKRGDQVLATLTAVVAAAAIEDHPNRDARIAACCKVLAAERKDVAMIPAGAFIDMIGDIPDEIFDLGKAIIAVRESLKE